MGPPTLSIVLAVLLNLHLALDRGAGPSLSVTAPSLGICVEHLGLPTWSRAYVRCGSRSSEIGCDAVHRASAAIRAWERAATPANAIHSSLNYLGICNHALVDMTAVIIGMATSSIVYVSSWAQLRGRVWRFRNAYEYPPSGAIRYGPRVDACNASHRRIPVINFLNSRHFSFPNTHFFLDEPYMPSLAYLHGDFAPMLFAAFGLHAQYFLLNYIFRFPDFALNTVRNATSAIPLGVRLFGIHLRWHLPSFFFLDSINHTIEIVAPFCADQKQKRPTVFAAASDSQELIERLNQQVPLMALNLPRKSDGDQTTALFDLALLMFCDEFLGTARSTFSSMVHLRIGRAPWLILHSARTIWKAHTSQIAHCLNNYALMTPKAWLFELSLVGHVSTDEAEARMRKYYKYYAF
jgi:hypothetical protein